MKIRAWLGSLLAVALLVLPIEAAAQTPIAALSVGSGSGLPGATGINVPVSLNSQGGAQVAGLNFDLTFDSSRLAYAGCEVGPAADSADKGATCTPQAANRVRVIIFGFNQNVIPDGTVVIVRFDVLGGAAPGTSILSLSNTAASDPDGDPVTVDGTDGSFEVLAPPATDTPTATATDTLTPTPTPTVTSGGPTSTRTPTRTPTRTRTVTPTPTYTRTPGGPTDTAAPTRTRTLTPTVTRTVPAVASTHTATPTVDTTRLSTLTAEALLTGTPASGKDPGVTQTAEAATAAAQFEAAVAGTATALAEFDAAVRATATALAVTSPAPTPQSSGTTPRPDWAIWLVVGLGAVAILSLVALLLLIIIRRRSQSGS